MANIKSAKKRINTIKRQKDENKLVKSTIATLTKKFRTALVSGDLKLAETELNNVISYVDSACSKGIIHKNNASRKVSRLSSALDSAKKAPKTETKKEEVKAVEEVKAEVKEEPKKTTAAKKTTTKKTTTKKETK